MRDVFEAEKLFEEANEIKASQIISGRYRLRNLVNLPTVNLYVPFVVTVRLHPRRLR
jgi:hypothetical protein